MLDYYYESSAGVLQHKVAKDIANHPPAHLQVLFRAFQVALVVKNPRANVGDVKDSGSIPGLGKSLGWTQLSD